MRKLSLLFTIVLCFGGFALAQDQPGALPAPSASVASPTASAPAAPSPKPAYGGEASRWQFAMMYQYFRFRLPIGTANLQGFNTSVTFYATNSFGFEGDVAAGFGNVSPLLREKYVFYGGGPHVAYRRTHTVQPFVHALFGGTHLTRTQGVGPAAINNFGIVGGGGADILINSRFAIRGQGDVVETHFFSAWQTSFQVKGGIVINF